MISFSSVDYIILLLFFIITVVIGLLASNKGNDEDYLLSGRRIGLALFVITSVSTWYGGILGVGEFTYYYGIASWVTQGLPYYFFAILFAFFFAKKIRSASLYTIPEKLKIHYGKNVSFLSAFLIFILVSPAPYLLMAAYLLNISLGINFFISVLIVLVISVSYLYTGGFRSDVITDIFFFIMMFLGFIIIILVSYNQFGGYEYLINNLPEKHLTLTGGAPVTYILVWFFIAMWTFADPGFHQRSYAAKNGNIAKKGILISIILWFVFDFLTTVTGLYSRANIKELENPVLSFPMFADLILTPGLKGLFFAGLFATIFSTLNSFLFLSGTTIGKDIINEFYQKKSLKFNTRIGLILTSIVAIILVMIFPSVIELWYIIGSVCIPGIIFLIIGAYYEKFRIDKKFAFIEILLSTFGALAWIIIKGKMDEASTLYLIEPMIVGLLIALIIHLFGMKKLKNQNLI